MRLFIAIDIDNEKLAKDVYTLQNVIRNIRVRATFPRAEHLHITLKFLGEVSSNMIDDLINRLEGINHGKFNITLSGLGGFPDLSRPRVIFIDVIRSERLITLHRKIENALHGLFPREDRPFHPHLTIARIKQFIHLDRSTIEKMENIIGEYKIWVDKFKLKKSVLTSGGPIYEDLKIFTLD